MKAVADKQLKQEGQLEVGDDEEIVFEVDYEDETNKRAFRIQKEAKVVL